MGDEPQWLKEMREKHPRMTATYFDPDDAEPWAVVDASGKVVNVVRLPAVHGWKPPAGCRLVKNPTAAFGIGDRHDGTRFTKGG